MVIGPPTCGIGGVPGVTIGQVCMSPTLAAGCPPIKTVGYPTAMAPPWAVGSPILGVVENMGSTLCPTCGADIALMSRQKESGGALAILPTLGRIGFDPALGKPLDGYHPLTLVEPSSPTAKVLLQLAECVAEAVNLSSG